MSIPGGSHDVFKMGLTGLCVSVSIEKDHEVLTPKKTMAARTKSRRLRIEKKPVFSADEEYAQKSPRSESSGVSSYTEEQMEALVKKQQQQLQADLECRRKQIVEVKAGGDMRKVYKLLDEMSYDSRRADYERHGLIELVSDAYKELEKPVVSEFQNKNKDVLEESMVGRPAHVKLILASTPEMSRESDGCLPVLKMAGWAVKKAGGSILAGDATDTFHKKLMTQTEMDEKTRGWRIAWKGKVDMAVKMTRPECVLDMISLDGGTETQWERSYLQNEATEVYGKTKAEFRVTCLKNLDALVDYLKTPVSGSRSTREDAVHEQEKAVEDENDEENALKRLAMYHHEKKPPLKSNKRLIHYSFASGSGLELCQFRDAVTQHCPDFENTPLIHPTVADGSWVDHWAFGLHGCEIILVIFSEEYRQKAKTGPNAAVMKEAKLIQTYMESNPDLRIYVLDPMKPNQGIDAFRNLVNDDKPEANRKGWFDFIAKHEKKAIAEKAATEKEAEEKPTAESVDAEEIVAEVATRKPASADEKAAADQAAAEKTPLLSKPVATRPAAPVPALRVVSFCGFQIPYYEDLFQLSRERPDQLREHANLLHRTIGQAKIGSVPDHDDSLKGWIFQKQRHLVQTPGSGAAVEDKVQVQRKVSSEGPVAKVADMVEPAPDANEEPTILDRAVTAPAVETAEPVPESPAIPTIVETDVHATEEPVDESMANVETDAPDKEVAQEVKPAPALPGRCWHFAVMMVVIIISALVAKFSQSMSGSLDTAIAVDADFMKCVGKGNKLQNDYMLWRRKSQSYIWFVDSAVENRSGYGKGLAFLSIVSSKLGTEYGVGSKIKTVLGLACDWYLFSHSSICDVYNTTSSLGDALYNSLDEYVEHHGLGQTASCSATLDHIHDDFVHLTREHDRC